MSAEEQAIQGVIDQIWDTYDVDKSGALDKQETKKFVQDTLGNLGSGDEFSDEAFDEVFATFDKDGSGTVEKSEMVVFVKQLLGGSWAASAPSGWGMDLILSPVSKHNNTFERKWPPGGSSRPHASTYLDGLKFPYKVYYYLKM